MTSTHALSPSSLSGNVMQVNQSFKTMIHGIFALCGLLLAATPTWGEDQNPAVTTVRYRVTGLFQPDRTDDLREELKQWPEVTLVSVDYKTAEAEFSFEMAKVFPGTKPAQLTEQFDNRLRNLSRGTFGIRALPTVPRDKWQVVEIPIVGLDCKGCSLGAYDAVFRLKGVEQATASFKDGLVTAWINPDETDRAKLEEALKQRRVTLKQP
jgi:hypothetical protein